MRSSIVRLICGLAAFVGLLSGVAPASSATAAPIKPAASLPDEQAWGYDSTTNEYPECGSGQAYVTIMGGHVKCGTWYTVVDWSTSRYTRSHFFVVGTDNAVWNYIVIYDMVLRVVAYQSGWRSLGGQVRSGAWVPAVYSVSHLRVRALALATGVPYCRTLNGSWGAWYAC